MLEYLLQWLSVSSEELRKGSLKESCTWYKSLTDTAVIKQTLKVKDKYCVWVNQNPKTVISPGETALFQKLNEKTWKTETILSSEEFAFFLVNTCNDEKDKRRTLPSFIYYIQMLSNSMQTWTTVIGLCCYCWACLADKLEVAPTSEHFLSTHPKLSDKWCLNDFFNCRLFIVVLQITFKYKYNKKENQELNSKLPFVDEVLIRGSEFHRYTFKLLFFFIVPC